MMWGVKPGRDQTSSFHQNLFARARSLRGWCWVGGQDEQQKQGGMFAPPQMLSVPRAPRDVARLWCVDPQ